MEQSESILLEAERLTSNDRNDQYGSIKQSFETYAEIVKPMISESEWDTLEGGGMPPAVIAKVMIAIKLGRESYKHKRDNLVDATGYIKILDELES